MKRSRKRCVEIIRCIYLIGVIALGLMTIVGTTSNGGGNGEDGAVSPDLVMTSCTIPSSGVVGGEIHVEDTVTNQGSGNAGTLRVGLYLSSDSTITTSDVLLAYRDVSSLAPGASSSGAGNVTIPIGTTAGTYFFGAIADCLDDIAESNEGNNVSTVSSITLSPSQLEPDLVVSSFTAPSSGVVGDDIYIEDTVLNQGTGDAGGFYVGIYLSSNSTISTSDTLIAYREISSLASGASSNAAGNVTIPTGTTAGTYYIGVIADTLNDVAESDESNNVSTVSSITISGGQSEPDLVMSSFTAPSSGVAGNSIYIEDTVYNQGNGDAGAFYLGIYLSSNSTITTSDSLIAVRYVSSLASGASSSGAGAVTIPAGTTAGNYYIGVIADTLDDVAESDEGNNVSSAVSITISSPGQLPDLVMSSFTVPSSGVAGGDIYIEDTVSNQDNGNAGPFYVGIYLSTNNIISTLDTLIGYRLVLSLASGASSNGAGNVTIPTGTTTGSYYIGAIADDLNNVAESDEGNNVSSAVSIAIN